MRKALTATKSSSYFCLPFFTTTTTTTTTTATKKAESSLCHEKKHDLVNGAKILRTLREREKQTYFPRETNIGEAKRKRENENF